VLSEWHFDLNLLSLNQFLSDKGSDSTFTDVTSPSADHDLVVFAPEAYLNSFFKNVARAYPR